MDIDIHNYKKKLERSIELLKASKVCKENKENIIKFQKQLVAEGITIGRIQKYVYTLKSLAILLNKPFTIAKKDDIIELVSKVETNPKWTEWTKSDFKKMLKRFYKWLKQTDECPKEVRWIRASVKNGNRMLPEEILTKEEIERLANATENLRDKAFILLLYESGCRIGELLPLKIKHIQFDEHGCILLVEGKTGSRRIRAIDYTKDLIKWLDSHPLKEDSEAFVWMKFGNKNELVGYASITSMLRSAREKSGITKAVNPHAFRHARATHLAKELPEAIMKEHFGWTQSSDMASVYYHLSGKDVDDALLKMHGFKPEEEKELKNVSVRMCPRCNEPNSVLSHFCKRCSSPLSLKIALESEQKLNKEDQQVLAILKKLVKQFPKVKKFLIKESKKLQNQL